MFRYLLAMALFIGLHSFFLEVSFWWGTIILITVWSSSSEDNASEYSRCIPSILLVILVPRVLCAGAEGGKTPVASARLVQKAAEGLFRREYTCGQCTASSEGHRGLVQKGIHLWLVHG